MSEKQAKKGPVVVSILNLKGGVGKTTVAALLARYASGTGGFSMGRGQKNLDVLAVDLDPQANLSQALMGKRGYEDFMNKDKEEAKSIVELFNAPARTTKEEVVKRTARGLDIIPSRFDFADNLVESLKTDERVLRTFIGREMTDKNLIIIDCAPTESILTRAAYYASDYILIPVRPEFFATIGFPLMKTSLTNFYDDNPDRLADPIKVFALINYPFSGGNNGNGSGWNKQRRSDFIEIRRKASAFQWPILYNPMWNSTGFPNWMEEQEPGRLGAAANIWTPIADEIIQLLFDEKIPASAYEEGAGSVRHMVEVWPRLINAMQNIRDKHMRPFWGANEGCHDKVAIAKKFADAKGATEREIKEKFPWFTGGLGESVKQIAENLEMPPWEKRLQIDKLIVKLMEEVP